MKLFRSTNEKKFTNINIQQIATGQGDNYKTSCLLDYSYFKNYYTMIAIDLSKQQALDSDPKVIQQFNFAANRGQLWKTTMFFIIEEAKETILDFSQVTVKVIQFHYNYMNF